MSYVLPSSGCPRILTKLDESQDRSFSPIFIDVYDPYRLMLLAPDFRCLLFLYGQCPNCRPSVDHGMGFLWFHEILRFLVSRCCNKEHIGVMVRVQRTSISDQRFRRSLPLTPRSQQDTCRTMAGTPRTKCQRSRKLCRVARALDLLVWRAMFL